MKSTIVTLLAVAGLAAGCNTMNRATQKEAVAQPTPVTVDAAAKVNASGVAEISFAKNSSELTEEARQSLVDTLNATQISGTIADIKVLAWADKDYPSKEQKALSKTERDLADKRAKAVKSFIASIVTTKKIDIYNMAKRPSALASLFHTSDSRVKKAMIGAGIPDSESLNNARISKASNAIVMVIQQ